MRCDPQSLRTVWRSSRCAWRRRLLSARLIVSLVALAGPLAACKSVDEPPRPAVTPVGARLAPTGDSTMTGRVVFWEVDGGLGIGVNVANVRVGQWRVVIHANGNCTSANGFSAGPPLEIPGVPAPIAVVVSTNDFIMTSDTFRLKGLTLEGPNGVMGRSVVVHSGIAGPLDAVPGVPNNRYACGVIERNRALF
jgi:Cu-Zn family superoxide dismutase